MKNAKFNTFDVKRTCEKKLGIQFRSNGEFNGWFTKEGKRLARITIPKGRKPIAKKTYKSMAIQLKLKVDELDDLLECPLKEEGYIKILKSKVYDLPRPSVIKEILNI